MSLVPNLIGGLRQPLQGGLNPSGDSAPGGRITARAFVVGLANAHAHAGAGAVTSGASMTAITTLRLVGAGDITASASVAGTATSPDDFDSANATEQWLINEQASAPYTNSGSSGSATLANTGGTISGTTPKVTWTSDTTAANSNRLVCSDSTTGNSVNEDMAGRIIFRDSGDGWNGGDYLFTKWTSGDGYFIHTLSNGSIVFVTHGGTGRNKTTTGAHDDGSWHVFSWMYDYSADLLYTKTDLTSSSSTNFAGSTAWTNTGTLSFNSLNGGTGGGEADLELRYIAMAQGATAQAFYDEDVTPPAS